MRSLDHNIWRSTISLQSKFRLYNVYTLPILLYGADTWSMTKLSSWRLDAFDQWCLRRIVYIPYTAHITSEEVRRRIGQPPITLIIAKRWLRLFGHLARADPSQDHSCILQSATNHPPADWWRRAGRPRRTWLRTIELDLQPHNLGLNTAWMRAQGLSKWHQLLETARFTDGDGRVTQWWWWRWWSILVGSNELEWPWKAGREVTFLAGSLYVLSYWLI